MKIISLILLFTFCVLTGFSQEWTLEQCINYAIEHNLDAQTMKNRIKESKIKLCNSRNNRLPNLNAGLEPSIYFGRGPGRTGSYQDNTQLNTSFNVVAILPIFSGFSIKHDIQGREFELQASLQDLEEVRENISMNVLALYMQVIMCKELLQVAKDQVQLSQTLVNQKKWLVDAGRILESELFDSQAVLSNDKFNQIQSENELNQSLLNLSQALNLEKISEFDITHPILLDTGLPMPNKNVENADSIYKLAINRRPAINAEKNRLKSMEENLAIAKAKRYPNINLSGGYANSYFYSFIKGYNNSLFWEQLKNNGNEFLSVNISIPIFNRLVTRNQIRSANISIENQKIVIEQTQQDLRKQIDQACNSFYSSWRKYEAAQQSLHAANEAFKNQQDRMTLSKTTIYDYIDAKNRLRTAKSNLLQAKFEYIFSVKILEFYKWGHLACD
ncbi:TolC family protein [uncultured Alistipes sp.]|uniref:TolC family protein n=1 Tax=uncultured Alistipes sp. TaxID=538949 RepID=UPI00259BE2AE|nr:TolC family protein [uncultured Alistipes sp.]